MGDKLHIGILSLCVSALKLFVFLEKVQKKQECIPVGDVPPASVVILGGVSAHWMCLPLGQVDVCAQ